MLGETKEKDNFFNSVLGFGKNKGFIKGRMDE